jgi:predicted ATPase/DNA-binding SARP family transcriptional activator
VLEVRLIGTFDIKCDGKPVILSSRVAQSLFAYLILTAGKNHRREKLAGMFWPDVAEAKARTYLRHELWRIRKALASKSKAEYLVADDISISFEASAEYWLDAAKLKGLGDSASTQEWMEGLSLFRGELLPGFYDDWVTQEREHLQVIYEKNIARLLELLEQEKRWNDILAWAERWISSGGAPEAAYRYMMIAYDALGDQAKVVSTYQRCAQALREMDLEPSEQTRALAFKRASKLNIPIPLTSFIGREKELNEIAGLFSKSRLVTLTGSGGVGKTRLAIQVAADMLDRFPDGVWFVDLAPLTDPALVPNTVAKVLGLRDTGESSLADHLIDYFRFRAALLIFDNCEHVIDVCAGLVYSLLSACADLAILATSRESLRVSGEIPYRVPSLEIPKPEVEFTIDELSKIESVKLFVARAEFALLNFQINAQNETAIAKICQRLDGIPLAIELAAARVNLLSVQQILERLDNRFNLLTYGLRSSLPRHQTLQAMIEWSYDLLTENERILFNRLAVFKGGCTLESAEQVCVGSTNEPGDILNLLTQLVDKSLLTTDTSSGEPRYYRLETIQQFARQKLVASGKEEQICSRHLHYFLKLARTAEPELYGARQVEWAQKLVDEHENMRAALQWSFERDLMACQELAGALWWSWNFNGYLSEGYEWLTRILEATRGNETRVRADLLSGAGWLASMLDHDGQSIRAFSEESLALFRQLGDREGAAFPLSTLAALAHREMDYSRAVELAQESYALYKEAGNKWGLRHILSGLGYMNQSLGNLEEAKKCFAESLSISKEIGDQEGAGWILLNLGGFAESQGDGLRALEIYGEALEIEKVVKNMPVTAWIVRNMGLVSIRLGDYEEGRLSLQEAMELNRKMGDQFGVAFALQNLGLIARLEGEYPLARSLYTESLKLSHQIQDKGSIGVGFLHVGQLMGAQSSPEKFAYLLGVAERMLAEVHQFIEPFFQMETEKFVEQARAALGDEAYEAAREAGSHLELEEAVAYALRELQ